MHDALRAALKASAAAVSTSVLDRMYENPFWMERYGDRGRRFADEDSLFHFQYLDQALAADDGLVFEKYARWLRTILVSRGMCSEHLAENFRLMAEALAASGIPESAPAIDVLERGVRSLIHADGPAGGLEARRAALLAAVAAADDAGRLRDDDRRYLVSYLIDASATGSRDAFELFAARCDAAVVDALRRAATTAETSRS